MTLPYPALVAWSALTVGAVAYVAYDAFARTPLLKVMRWGWVLVTLYMGPLGATLYVASCRAPTREAHERFIAPQWRQAVGPLARASVVVLTIALLAGAVALSAAGSVL